MGAGSYPPEPNSGVFQIARERRRLPLTVAIIGAGMAGLTCARILDAAGLKVRIFDRGRGPGGRMSTRRSGRWHFDHGAQYLTAREPEFQAQVKTWTAMGLVEPWSGRLVKLRNGVMDSFEDGKTRYVGVPGMSAIMRHLAQGLDVRLNTEVTILARDDRSWRLEDFAGNDLGVFDATVVALPGPQAAQLSAGLTPLAENAAVEVAPCWSLMVGFDQPLDVPFDGAFIDHRVLAWSARNNSKPGRPSTEAWVLHATQAWSTEHAQQGGEQVAAMLLAAFAEAINGKLVLPATRICHRWRFAQPLNTANGPCLYDWENRIGACGDWCSQNRIEGAWLSGCAMASRILGKPVSPTHPQATV
jgi:renalase